MIFFSLEFFEHRLIINPVFDVFNVLLSVQVLGYMMHRFQQSEEHLINQESGVNKSSQQILSLIAKVVVLVCWLFSFRNGFQRVNNGQLDRNSKEYLLK